MRNFGKKLLLFLIVVGSAFTLNAQPAKNLETLYQKRSYFVLRDELAKQVNDSSNKILFYRGAVANKFNQPLESVALLKQYLQGANAKTESKTIAEAYKILADSYIKSYQYANAAASLKIVLSKYKIYYGKVELKDIESDFQIYKSVSKVVPQTASLNGDTEIQASRDKANLLNIPVEISNQRMDFVFDTGANQSTLTVSTAKKLGLSLIESNFDVGTSSNIRVKSELAVAPTLRIGNAEFHNVIFLVIPDSALSFPKANYQINGIVGFPVIEAMRQITITKNDKLIVPANPSTKKTVQNLCLDGLTPMIEGSYKGERMFFEFDTGAVTSTLYAPFFQTRRREILAKYKPQKMGVGGAGGVQRVLEYKLKNESFEFAGKTVVFPEIDLVPKSINEDSRYFYGSVGQDLIKQFDHMTIDFAAMSIVFE